MRILSYPKLGSEPNQYISMFARSLIGFGGSVCAWAERGEQAGHPDAVVLHWLENKFVPKPTGSKGLRQRIQAQRARLKKIEPVLHEFAKMRSQGTRVVWVAHYRRPHRWQGSASQYRRVSRPLWPQVDAVVHLTRASIVDPAFDHLKNHPHAVVPHMHCSLVDPTLHRSRATDVTRLAFIRCGRPPARHGRDRTAYPPSYPGQAPGRRDPQRNLITLSTTDELPASTPSSPRTIIKRPTSPVSQQPTESRRANASSATVTEHR